MRINLNVPYSDKEKAKDRGAKWDAKNKTWYVEDGLEDSVNLRLLMQWVSKRLQQPTKSTPLVHPEFIVVQPRSTRLKKKNRR